MEKKPLFIGGLGKVSDDQGTQAALNKSFVSSLADSPISLNAGHKGVESVIRALRGNEFYRVRVGIKPSGFFGAPKKPRNVASFVLKKFGKSEAKKLSIAMSRAIELIETEIQSKNN